LQQEVVSLTAELTKLNEEKNSVVRRARQFQEELGTLNMKLAVLRKDVRKARSVRQELQKNVDRLQEELGKKMYLAQTNLRRIVDKFREKTKAEIEVATATTLQSWSEQVAELQQLCADNANCEAVQKNLTTDFMRIALTPREEITKL
jgi:chromosome segregation ATPase